MDLLSVSIPTQYVYYYKKYVIMRIKRKITRKTGPGERSEPIKIES